MKTININLEQFADNFMDLRVFHGDEEIATEAMAKLLDVSESVVQDAHKLSMSSDIISIEVEKAPQKLFKVLVGKVVHDEATQHDINNFLGMGCTVTILED